jgi:virginiamycin B lyase
MGVSGNSGWIAALLFTLSAISPAQRVAIGEYSLLPPSAIGGITAGSDGALWFTEGPVNKVGRITTAAAITGYPPADG